MTQWLLLFSNPVVFLVTAGAILIGLYMVQQANPEAAYWSLTIICTLLFALLYAAISVVKQIRGRQTANTDGQLYNVFSQEDIVLVQLGNNLNKLTKNPQDIMRSLSHIRTQLAERYGFVVPDVEMEFNSTLPPQTVQLMVRQDVLGQFDIYPDCLAVPVAHTQVTLTDTIDGQLYAWTPNEEIALQDRAIALTARDFMALKIQGLLLDHAPQVMTRTDVLKLMAIVQRQDPGIFHDLFELNKLNPNAFRHILAELLQQRVSVRNIVSVCESLLKGDAGISQLARKQGATLPG
jgi:flagellar biosynthesis component FlhA